MPISFTSFSIPGSYHRISGFRSWPIWARLLLTLVALPGLVIASLSLLLLIASILALSILALPAYIALSRILAGRSQPIESAFGMSPGAKRVEVTVLQ